MQKIYAKAWKIQIGRIPLYLLDTDIPVNSRETRKITGQ
jgi:starch phosphorylase